tara:strand:- start:2187 stop:2429 length:243 start_codon:yes stop_codon:yes gene_type:complete
LNFPDGGTSANALMTKMGRSDAVLLEEEDLRITEASSGGDLRAITGGTKASQQSCLRTAFKGGMNRHHSSRLQFTAEAPT